LDKIASSALAACRAVLYVALTLPLMPLQALFVACGWRAGEILPRWYHARCARLFGISIKTMGTPVTDRPVLFVANHISYIDIVAFSALAEVSFVAKTEIAGWPFFGWLAKLQRTVFVGRQRARVADEKSALETRLAAGGALVLFAEGTTGDGNRTRPFKSALFAAADRSGVIVQPVTIAYTRLDGMPLCRALRPAVAWYGDMELLPHLWAFIGLGRIGVEVIFHAPTSLAAAGSRKHLAQHCERVIAHSLAAANAGRETPSAPALAAHGRGGLKVAGPG
jgi:lyso-ornithine lipid O-acyltransferase